MTMGHRNRTHGKNICSSDMMMGRKGYEAVELQELPQQQHSDGKDDQEEEEEDQDVELKNHEIPDNMKWSRIQIDGEADEAQSRRKKIRGIVAATVFFMALLLLLDGHGDRKHHHNENMIGLDEDLIADAYEDATADDVQIVEDWQMPGPSPLEKVPVCITLQRDVPTRIGIYMNNYMRQFGGRLEFAITKTMGGALRPYYNQGEVTKDILDPVVMGKHCPDDGLQMMMLERTIYNGRFDSKSRKGSVMIQNDEFCKCGKLCEVGGAARFRNYYHSKFAHMTWVPLGPRYEWKYTTPDEITPMNDRQYPYSFHGSISNPVREKLMNGIQDEGNRKKYPFLDHGASKWAGGWHKMIVGHEKYAEPAAYRDILLNSKFVLCPRGHNPESFRLFEAIDAGAIPVLARDETSSSRCKNSFQPLIDMNAPFLWVDSWRNASAFEEIQEALKDPIGLQKMQNELGRFRTQLWTNITKRFECELVKEHVERKPKRSIGKFNVDEFCG